MNREALLAKIRALQKRAATDGERKAAERAARRIIEKYGLDDSQLRKALPEEGR